MIDTNCNIDELIHERELARANKQWVRADEIRDFLETKWIFVFDAVYGQEVHHLNKDFFRFKDKFENTKKMTNRKYVEYTIERDSRANRVFDGWLKTQLSK